MARKTTGSTSTRSKKTAPTTESAAVQPAPVPVAPHVLETAPTSIATKTIVNKASVNLDEEIRHRAYELYLQRNGSGGDPNADWFIAEREVRARYAVAGRSA